MAVTRDFYVLADICNDDYSIMARLIKNEVGMQFKYAKILADLNTMSSDFHMGLLDKYNPAISRVLDIPIMILKQQIDKSMQAIVKPSTALTYTHMIDYLYSQGCTVVEFKLDRTLLYGCLLFLGTMILDHLETFEGDTKEEAMTNAYKYVKGK